MKYFLIAGEPSGDNHGSELVKAIRILDSKAKMSGWGGDKMESVGVTIHKHCDELAIMGVVEVISRLPEIFRNFRQVKKEIKAFEPDAIILIDYPGFNLKIARWGSENGYKIFYYISPKAWAWNKKRVHLIGKYTDRLFSILPFEVPFYKSFGYDISYVGNPTLEQVASFLHDYRKNPVEHKQTVVALLPGSRRQELKRMLPIMLQLTNLFPTWKFQIAKAPSLNIELFEEFTSAYPGVDIIDDDTYGLLLEADYAIVTSGTATLETALFNVPQVVAYIAHPISWAIGRRLVKLEHISLVNLILDEDLVRELLQHDCNIESLASALRELSDPVARNKMLNGYERLRSILGEPGAADNAASIIVSDLK